MLDAAKVANAAAGVVVGKVGTAVIHKGDLKNILEENAVRTSQNILQLNELKQIVSQAKSYKKTIVLPTVVLICCMPATSGICRLQRHLRISSSWG